MLQMIYTGMKRRRKETRYVSIVTFVAVLFMTGITLFQNIMNAYVFETNLQNYGDWVISSVNQTCTHPYLQVESSIRTGSSLVDEEGKSLELYIGKADENFQKLYDEIVYEGRMPMEEDEIAMDISALAILGYSYEIGQIVEVSYLDAEGMIQTKSFQLVGTLKNFSAIWKGERQFPLPNAIVTEKAFEVFRIGETTTYFYQLNPKYNAINTREFADSFRAKEGEAQIYPVTYNDYVYENKVWGTSEMFENVTTAIIFIGVLAIGYLLTVYMGRRRETYYRCRCIGASKMQIRGMICFECIMITLPQVIIGMGVAYTSACLGCEIAQKQQFAVNFIVDENLFVKQIVSACAIIVFAIVAVQCGVSDKRIAGNMAQIKPKKFKELRRAAKRAGCPEKTVFRRQKMLHPIQRWIANMFSVLVCGCLILCLFKIYDRYENTQRILEGTVDFSMAYEEAKRYSYEYHEGPGISGIGEFAPDDLSMGVDETFLEAVKTSPGIKSIELYWTDSAHIFEWEGMNESEIVRWLKSKQEYHTPLEYDMKMVFYKDVDAMKQALTEEQLLWLETEQNIDWEAVERGEQIIMDVCLAYSEIVWGEDDFHEEYHFFEEKTLHQGDSLDIVHFQEGSRTTVKVGGIFLMISF